MHDYIELIEYFIHFDSLAEVNKHKIKPDDSELYLNLAWSLPEAAKTIFNSIKQSNLSHEYKEVLILDLHKRAMEVDAGDYVLNDYNKRVMLQLSRAHIFQACIHVAIKTICH